MSGPTNVMRRRDESLRQTDMMPGPLRECVHEFGFAIVDQCRMFGIKEPARIRQLVRTVWDGARSPVDRPHSTGGSHTLGHLDWLLIQAGAQLTAPQLIRLLWDHGMAVIPKEPSELMVQASIDETGKMGLVSKKDKHRLRLRAAIRAAAVKLYPVLRPSA